ncbi:RNA-binding protein 4F isoform X1 [Drosophila sechellia]|uniref:RNA-binding protein 4F isoform X1 n=1 Tax=Drosophila sechellia TaxID=7238 RepID=UPI0013DE25EE|nr:RNA-binding protein 4F isoform X1 [Drosophila sechellia]
MDAEKQLESQLEKELDEMSAEDLGVDAYDEYDLIVIPDEGKGSPQKASSESPQKARSESPQKARSESPQKARSESPQKARSESPQKARSESPQKARSESPQKARNESPQKARNESPQKARNESPQKARNESPQKARNESPQKARNESPQKARSESPQKARSESPQKARSESPQKARSESPQKARSESPQKARSESPQQEEHKSEELGQGLRPSWPPSPAGGDMTTIELSSSDDESLVEKAEEYEDDDRGKADNDSICSGEDVGVIDEDVEVIGEDVDMMEDSDLKSNSEESSDSDSDSDSDTGEIQRVYRELNALPNKKFAQMVSLVRIAFKLNDLDRIESSVLKLKSLATVPAHVWLKYLKVRMSVTQTEAEHKAFQEQCATALGYYYSIPLCEYIVNYLVDQGQVENHMLWAKLLADYDVERPDFGDKLRSLITTITDADEAADFEELLQNRCVTWTCTVEQRKMIKSVVDKFKQDLAETTHCWKWPEELKPHIYYVKTLPLDDDLKNAVIRFIFERLVSKFPIFDALWLSYIDFIQYESATVAEDVDEDNLNAEMRAKRNSRLGRGFLRSTELDLARRGVRSQPSVELNHRFLDLMERTDFELAEVDEEILVIQQHIMTDMEMIVELHLDYLAYRVRNTNVSDEEQVASLRGAFNHAWEELTVLYGDEADTRYEVLQLWAQVEYTHLANPDNGREIWRQIMGYPGSTKRGMLWLTFAQMESEYNAGHGTRDVLRKALLQPVLEDGILVQDMYRRFERCYGTYESIANCQAVELPAAYAANPRQQQQQSNREPKNRDQPRRQAQQQPKQGNKMSKTKPSGGASPPSTSKVKGPANEEAKKSNFKYSPNMEINKIFVRNLYSGCSKKELYDLFSSFGTIIDVRLVYKLNKQFKGIAYVEFEKPGEAQRAVAGRDGYLFQSMNISVAISNPPPRGSSAQAAKPSVATKRRVPTSLIPTTVVRQEGAKKLRLILDEPGGTSSTSAPADVATNPEANGEEQKGDDQNEEEQKGEEKKGDDQNEEEQKGDDQKEEEMPAVVPKSNDDFRKMFLKD